MEAKASLAILLAALGRSFSWSEPVEVRSLAIWECSSYPYWEKAETRGAEALLSDFQYAVERGLGCMESLNGGFNRGNASRLRALLADASLQKTIACAPAQVGMFAKSTLPPPEENPEPFLPPYPGIALDLNMIGGNYPYPLKPEAMAFFKEFKSFAELKLRERTRQPGLVRRGDLPQLLFHETLHWLGFVHSSDSPEVVDLYEWCCFGALEDGSTNPETRRIQARSCAILGEESLWRSRDPGHEWTLRGLDREVRGMREFYDRYFSKGRSK